ncbi:MAG: DnaD domain protein [Erysipelotrichaceae bacterium]|nr:DnaD domain protein [Erysipelotrichaceae bacterium]
MLGKDYYRIETDVELSGEKLKSLVFFYGPLIGCEALNLYEYLVLKGSSIGYAKLNDLLQELNLSIDHFEELIGHINEFRLLKTLKKEDHYIFVLQAPLDMNEFIKDDIFVRYFILKTSGANYQKLISTLVEPDEHRDFENVSKTLTSEALSGWTKSDETYINKSRKSKKEKYDFNTLFDINVFLKDISPTLFPMRFRTRNNLEKIAIYGDLYDVSYDRMRVYLAQVSDFDADSFDLKKLEKACMSSSRNYEKIEKGRYDVPCVRFLMSLQDGKEVTESDRYLLSKLSAKYHLSAPVINVLVEYGLKNCDNRLVEKYLTKTAADLHRNDINTADEALKWLYNSGEKRSEDKLPSYDTSNNTSLSESDEEELLKLMGKK